MVISCRGEAYLGKSSFLHTNFTYGHLLVIVGPEIKKPGRLGELLRGRESEMLKATSRSGEIQMEVSPRQP